MPSCGRWGASAQARMPLTPPDFQPSYNTNMSAASEENMHSFYHPHSYANRHMPISRDYNERYLPPFSNQSSLSLPSHTRSKQLPGTHDYHMGYSHAAAAQYHYAPIAPPMLPPIRVSEDSTGFASNYPHAHPEPKMVEEKPTGGVAQHLDYEMELMSSFVAETSQRIVSKTSSPTSQFRKYVSQILSSTRLPSSTIMLGLFYLQERMRLLSQRGQDSFSSGTVYRMLTTCLLLGSKFLDDNTFQNRSWAEVSSIPVAELNTMELEWLKDFNWEIHGLMYDRDEGFFMWIEHWHAYEEKAQLAKAKETQKLAPLETNFSRHHVSPRPLMSPEGPIPPQYQQGPQYETQWARAYMSDYSPPSAPDSGPATPEYFAHPWAYPQPPQSYARASWHSAAAGYGPQRIQLPAYHAPFQPQPYNHSNWVGHGVNCGCTLCAKHSDYYFNHPGYGVQTVSG